MTNEAKAKLAEMRTRQPAIDAAHERANRTALLEHARMGRSIPTMEGGKIVHKSPKEVFAMYGFDEFGRPLPETTTQTQ